MLAGSDSRSFGEDFLAMFGKSLAKSLTRLLGELGAALYQNT